MFYGRRSDEGEALPPLTQSRVYPLLCLSLPHRWFPIGKTRSLCLRCNATSTTLGAPKRTRASWRDIWTAVRAVRS